MFIFLGKIFKLLNVLKCMLAGQEIDVSDELFVYEDVEVED
jgi:hypothetical protein